MTTYEYIGVGLALMGLATIAFTMMASRIRTRRDREVARLRGEIRAHLSRAAKEALAHPF